MRVLESHIDPRSGSFQANREWFLAKLAELEEAHARINAGGGEKYVARHRERGKLMARERIELLLDRDAPFLEIGTLAGWGSDFALGGSVICGLGVVSGSLTVIIANEPTIKGGSINPYSHRKIMRAMAIAEANALPIVNLTESGGADLPHQADLFVPGGRFFRELTRRSAAGIPTICLVFGSSTAGGAYVPGMSDYVVMVKERAHVFLGGPPLVKMAIHEDSTEEELGGAEMHSRVSGVSDYLAEDEIDAIRIGREILAQLDTARLDTAQLRATRGGGSTVEGDCPPIHDPEALLGIASADVRQPFDVREVIARVVDGSRFHAFKPAYGTTLVTGWAEIHGHAVGIVANNGVIFSESAEKGAQFIQLTNRRNIPLVFLQNITGMMVGRRYEEGGMIKDGAKMINAVSNSAVPHLTVMIGASYGAGNYAMSGRAFDPRFVWSWPNHRIAVMGPEQLAGVLSIVRRQAADRAGVAFDEARDAAMRQAVEQQIEGESDAFFASGQLWDDGVIDPRDTRAVLGISLAAVHHRPIAGAETYGVFRM